MPLHTSFGSHTSPEPVRQTDPLGCTTSAGHTGLTPSQVSVGSQVSPEPGRQTNPFGRSASAGQTPLEPVQVSAGSQAPAEGRHWVPPVLNWQLVVQQTPGVPLKTPSSHCSPRVPCTTPSPQRETSDTVTKCPSSAALRPPAPG